MNTDETIVDGDDDDGIISMDKVEAAGFELFPKGDYDVVISKCDYTLSNASGKPMWSMQLEITDGEYQGKKIFTFMSFSEKALPMTKTAMKVVAPEEADNANFNPKKKAASGDLLGRRFRIRLNIQEYEGEKRNNVKRWLAAQQANEFIA